MMNKSSILLLSFLLCALTVHGQDEPLVTDRPDITESALVIPRGYFQIEIGTSVELFRSNELNGNAYNLPTFLLRLGINDRIEVRVGSTYSIFQDRQQLNPENAQGMNGSEIGVKINLNDNSDANFRHALIAGVGVPYLVATELQESEFSTPTILYLASFNLNSWLSFSSNVGGVWSAQNGAASIVYTASFAFGLSNRIGAFTELYGAGSEDGPNSTSLDAGFTYLINNQMQLDASAGLSILPEVDYYFISAGYSWLFPIK